MRRSKIPSSLCLIAVLCCAIAVSGDAVAGEPPLRSGDFELRLGGFAFDPLAGEPQLPSGWEMKASGAADLHMIQFDGPIPAGTFAMLREAGVEPVQYIHPNTYIVWGRRGQRTALEGMEPVRWTGDFAPAYRVQPRWRNLEAETVNVKILIYRGADADAVIEAIGSLGGEQTGRLVVNEKFEVAGFELPGDLMQTVASVPGVYTVQVQATDGGSRGEVSDQINAGNLFSGLAIPGYGSWLDGLGLDGSGVTVAVVDEGVDWTHPDLLARPVPCTGGSCSSSSSVHGTHTAGIIAGDGSSYVLDGYNFLRGLGVAPGAGLVDQRFYPAMEQPGGVLALMTDSQRNGASLSNNSWGTSVVAAGYDVDAMLVDAGVRDADPERPGNQPLLYVLAINNGQGGTSTQGSPDEAKNTITVGASRALAGDGTQDPAIDSLASVSAHGPALDGRTIPHIVAPGCLVDSTYPDAGQGPQHYTRCGTSQAAPQISGAAALFIEHYRGLPGTTTDPSPALIKAAILPVAHDLDGNLDADGVAMGHRPDSKQGWGRLNLAAVVDPPAGSVLYFDQARVFEVSGEEWIRVVTPLDPAEPMKIMLTWTDAPGHGLGGTTPALSNDLDLVVELDGNTYLGNYFGTDGFSATGGSADTLDNTEGVFLQNPAGNDVTVRVQATNINSDGVPGYNDDTDQDFALVCYNCDLVPGFALAGHPVTRNTCSPDLSTWLLDVEQLSGYGNDVALTISGVPAGAIAGFDTNPVIPGGSSHLTLDPGTAVTANYAMLVTGDTVDMSRSIPVYLYLRTAAPDPAVLTLPADAAADIHPQPVLEWDPVTWTDHYLVEIAADAAFTDIIYTALEEGTSHAVLNTLEELATYYWRVRATNACGYGIFSPVRRWESTTTSGMCGSTTRGNSLTPGHWRPTTRSSGLPGKKRSMPDRAVRPRMSWPTGSTGSDAS